MNGVQGLGIPAFGQGPRPPTGGGAAIRKQRSQRFTVPYNPGGTGHARSQSGSTGSTPSPALPPPPPVPPLPYLAPPPPVQAQSLTPYAVTPGPGPGPVDLSSSLDFLASPTGMSPYPGPAFTSAQPTQSTLNLDGVGASTNTSNAGGGPSSPGMIATGAGSDEIIETAIVIKSIPFACPKEHLLAVMASLSLPAPFAFNYHFAPEDPTSFRGLAFANYRHPSEAAMVRAAMDGLEIMGRKLRAEFKKQLRPGEKEMIERTKAIKRMKSAQMLAATGSRSGGERGGGSGQRTNSLPDGFSRHGNATPFGGQQHDYAHVPPVPPIPPSFNQQQQQQQFGSGLPPASFSYGPPVSYSFHPSTELVNGAMNFQPPPNPSSTSSSDLVNHHDYDHRPRQETESSGGATGPDGNGSSSVVSVSDVGTSVSQRAARVSAGEEGEEEEEEEEEGASEIGDSDAGPRDHLDMNDPPTLELYSRVLLFSSDPLRDELSFSRSLSPAQRRTVHLIARKLELEHRSLGEGERRCVVVYKKGCAPPPAVAQEGDDANGESGGAKTQVASGQSGNGMGGDRLVRMDPPRRSLRGSVSSIALRHVASRDALVASSPTEYLYPSNYDFSSPSRAPGSINPHRQQHSGSSSGASSSMLPSPIGTGSNGPYTAQQQHLRGKKSMPDMRYHSHSLSSVSASSGSGSGAAAASMAMLPSFSGSGSSGLGAHHHHQHHQQQYGHRHSGSGSSSPYEAYSTPASSPLAINPPGSESTTGTGAAGRELTSSVSLGADLSGYLGARSSYQYLQQQQRLDQPQSRLADVAEAAFNAVPIYGDDSQSRQQQQPAYEQHAHFRAVDSPVTGADMTHGIRKSFSTMRLGDAPGNGSSGWNRHQFPSHQPSNGLAVEHDWPLDGTKTMGPRQIRRHVALPADWAQASQQQQQSDRPSLQTLFSSEPNALARPSTSSGCEHGLRSVTSVGAGLRSAGFGGGEGGMTSELEWRRRE